ncbi:hypothetical protein AEAC466_03770 [Asticcacaulis sp. AC466]|uniref:hypothetical protein n=1 Tax=Asticcacaulis sp. AC466 TaxID=1282362 RepID=UPI0003C3B724|nr:hypothetical protein [Asticcacaulis sp. AC466]ESQ86328.1 hypothetical protein AEAC466_03770 [Asticcacaulis sp. AC466]
MSLLIFGYGFIGAAFADAARAAGHTVVATIRSPHRREALDRMGIDAVSVEDRTEMARAVAAASGILITPPPGDDGCPAFAQLGANGLPANDLSGKWIGYLSTTGVYGNRDGGWVFEDSPLEATAVEGRRRILAETQWLSIGAQVFRLPGLYGHGRNVIDRLRDGTARRIHKPCHVFSRLHHDDCAAALMASLNHPRPGAVYNLCDDEPAPADTVLEYAATLTGLPLPPRVAWEPAAFSPTMQRFYSDNKRVSNARAKAELGWRPRYPTYREGLTAIFTAIQTDKKD